MKKLISIIFFVILTSTIFSSCKGYLYIGDGWQDTPEKALNIAAENPLEEERLTVATLLDTWHIDDMAFMLFVSDGDTLVEADFVTNKKNQFHYHGLTEEVLLEDLDTFVSSGDVDQFIIASYSQYGTQVWGYKYSSVDITVNGITPAIKTYTFTCHNKEWSIDRWWIDGIAENTEINIDYTTK